MSARRLLNVVETMLVEAHGRDEVDELLAPATGTRRDPEVARLAVLAMDGEVA